jgi:hypothetical protein
VRVRHEAVGFDHVQRGQRGDAGQRIAAEGGTVVARLEHAGGAAGREAGADRHAGAEPLGQGHDVGKDTGMLVGKPYPGAADAALDLVDHEQPVLLVADLAQRRMKYCARD